MAEVDAATPAAPRPRGEVPVGTLLLVLVQLVLALLVVRQFQLESRTFFNVMVLASAGFVVHSLLPLRHRLGFFAALSLASIILALGPLDGVSVIGLGLVMIGICHLRLALAWRVALLLAVGALFAAWRVGQLPQPWSLAIWPVVGSMFMFRLALYLHALKHKQAPPTPARTLAYFFMMPNVCFPLYPVVDWSGFARTWYERDAGMTYQTGVRWIARGLLHLLLYRYVYLHLTADPRDLATLGDLVRFILATFLLYLRVSGQFHLITGMLHLFGFWLPMTHHLYYLSAGFTDFWRRINIYWKDFMAKLVFHPSYFVLSRRMKKGNGPLILATALVFFATWILHSYQWFWLRGGFPLHAQDVLFWGILGTLAIRGSLKEMKKPRARTLQGTRPPWSAALAVRTVGTFIAICVLWSLWSADSLSGWLTMWMAAAQVEARELVVIGLLLAAGFVIAGWAWDLRESDDRRLLPRHAALTTGLFLLILGLGQTQVYARTAPRAASIIASLQRSTLNARDEQLKHKGYYELLDNTSRLDNQLWEDQARRPAHWLTPSQTTMWHPRRDFAMYDLRPETQLSYLDAPTTINRWGMRDRDREQAKPAGTYRIAFLGPSYVMGSGVPDTATFTRYLEERLNASPPGSPRRYEVLNFGVTGYVLTQQLALLTERVLSFQPDAVFIAYPPRRTDRMVEHLMNVILDGHAIPFPGLDSILRRSGAHRMLDPGPAVPFEPVRAVLGKLGMRTRVPWSEAHRRLTFETENLTAWTLRHLADVSRQHGAAPVLIQMDIVLDRIPGDDRALRDAHAAGFLAFDLLDLWTGRDHAALQIAPWDEHPNAEGNRIIADKLYELIQQHRAELRIR